MKATLEYQGHKIEIIGVHGSTQRFVLQVDGHYAKMDSDFAGCMLEIEVANAEAQI